MINSKKLSVLGKKEFTTNFLKTLCFCSGLLLVACVPSNPPMETEVKSQVYQFPEMNGDFGSINQIQQKDRVFSFVKDQNEESTSVTPEITIEGNDAGAFSISSKSGCVSLTKMSKCFVRVRASGKDISSANGVKQASLKVQDVVIPLSINFQKIETSPLQSAINLNPVEERVDLDCVDKSNCKFVIKYSNPDTIPHPVTEITVPSGYIIQSNSCGSILAAKKSCYVRFLISDNIQDLSSGTISLNTDGSSNGIDIRVIKENDVIAPTLSPEFLGVSEYDDGVYVLGNEVDLKLTFADNRDISKGLFYIASTDSTCQGAYQRTELEENIISVNLIPGQHNTIYARVKDALGNQSSCVPLPIKNLSLKHFSVDLTQPAVGPPSLSKSSNDHIHGSIAVVSYTPSTGYKLKSWQGDCLGSTGNSCSLTITGNKTVTAEVECDAGYSLNSNVCTINVVACSDVSGTGTQTWNTEIGGYGACEKTSCSVDYYLKTNKTCVVPSSCLQLKNEFSQTVSKTYNIIPAGKSKVMVYCDQTREGGGWTFFPNSAMGNNNVVDWDAYRTDKSAVLLYMTAAGVIRYQTLRQLPQHAHHNLQIRPTGGWVNELFFVPSVVNGTTNGFRYHNIGGDWNWAFTNCDSNNNSAMFFSNSNATYGTGNISPDIKNALWSRGYVTEINNYPSSTTYFSGGGISFGGCGTYVGSQNFGWLWTYGVR